MNETHKRALLYGGAGVVLAGVAFAWATTKAEADVMTLLSSADVQLRLAYGMPKADRDGRPLDSRENLIAAAEDHLASVERVQPGMAVTIEFRGFAHMLRGQYGKAAECYRVAQNAPDCQAEQRDVLAFNQARMLAQAGNRQQALDVFAANAAALDARFGHQRLLEEATILRQLGRRVDAEQQLDRVVRAKDATSMARLQAGLEYVELGHVDKAEAAFLVAKRDIPIAEYHLALLKLQQGDVDTSLEFLGRAFAARPAEVRQMLDQQADAWSAVVADARFRELASPAASPGR